MDKIMHAMKAVGTIITISLMASVLPAFGQEQPFALTLDQAVSYAIDHNKTLLNARDQFTSTGEKIKEAKAQGLPQINGSLDFMTYFNYELNFSFGGSSEGTPPPDFSQPPFDDGDRAMLGYIGTMFGSSEPIIMNNQMSAAVKVSQLIFSGQYWAGIQAAKIARELSEKNVVRTEQEVQEGVSNAYYLILITEQNLKIIGENANNLLATLQHTDNMFKAGMAEATDVDQLRIALSQLQNSRKMVERAIQMSYNMLKFQLGVAPDASITLTENIDGILARIDPASTLAREFNLSNNVGFSLTESQVKLSQTMLGMQNWAYSPTVAGFYSYTEKIITTGFDMTPKNLAGFTVSVPIFSSGMRRAQVSQSKIDLDIAKRNQELMKEQLETQQRLFNYQNALENYTTQKDNISTAGRVYTSIENKYKQGMVSSLDLTQASSNLLSAENNYLSSVLSLLQAQTALDKLYTKF
jgi:outer membrane protein TolC